MKADQLPGTRPDPGDWTLITVTYNSAEILTSAWSGVDLKGIRWIVVDNNSQDNSVQVARDLGADVISRSINAGFSSSNNLALAQVTSPWVAFVNPDVTIDPRSLPRLAKLSELNQALVSPQLIYPSGEHQENARGLPTPRAKLANRGIRIPGFDLASYARSGFQTPTYVAWLMGAALAGSTESFNHLGGWDDRYFIYYEDHDIGLRAWDADLKLVLDPRSEWVHTWQRATTTLNRSAWKAELRSAWTFYRTYPELITRGRVNRSERFDHIGPLLWQTALDV